VPITASREIDRTAAAREETDSKCIFGFSGIRVGSLSDQEITGKERK
jgi:hypothetical protein